MFAGGGLRDFLAPRAFAPGVPETRNFPLQTWERLQRQVLKEHGTRALLHSPPQGTEALRQAIAAYVNLERGARATPERVLVLTSSATGSDPVRQRAARRRVIASSSKTLCITAHAKPSMRRGWNVCPCRWTATACGWTYCRPYPLPGRCS